jgi:type IV pilus assembly protein PilY1
MSARTLKRKLAALAFLTLSSAAAHADDIDLYSGATANGTNPNVIILVDSRGLDDANFNFTCPYAIVGGTTTGKTLFDMIQCSLYGSLEAIKTQPSLLGKLNIGLMSYGTGSNKGGLWWSPAPFPTSLPVMDATGIVNAQSLVSNGITKANNGAAASVFQEAWAFFTGHTGLSGHSYSDHIVQSCQRSFIIYIGAATKNGNPSSGDSGLSDLQAAAATIGATVSSTPIDTSNLGAYTKFDSSSWMDEWAKFLYSNDFDNGLGDRQNIVTYTIAAQPDGTGDSLNFTQTLESTANHGGGKPFVAANLSDMTQALLKIFNEVQAVNSVFASPGLPVSSNAQGTYLNQIYLATFRPDATDQPRWKGNLKQYQFGVDTSGTTPSLFLADASWGPYQPNLSANSALSSAGTGFLSPNAISYWTSKNTATAPDLNGGFWVNLPQGAGGGYDLADGEFVEKGGVSQQLRLKYLMDTYTGASPTTARNLYTCIGCSSTSSHLNATANGFKTTNSGITATMLGITSPSSTVSSFARSGTTVTATLSTAPATALTNGQNVTIAGAANSELNGNFTIAVVNSTTFTYTITESPPATSTGTYTASLPSAGQKLVSSMSRVGTLVTATISAGHGYTAGQVITITGATQPEYNGSFTIGIPAVNPTTSFTYTIVDSPGAATTGGSATIGTTGTNGITFTSSQIVRSATASDGSSIVTVTASNNLPAAYATNALVNVTGVTPSGFNVALATVLFGGGNNTGNSCPGGSNKKSFCYKITTSPSSPATGTIMADLTAGSVAIAAGGLTHPVACTGGSPTPNVTVTATSSTAHPFTTGQTVNIGGTIGAGEAAYVGSFVVTKLSSTTFSFPLTTSPPCTPSATGATAVTAAGGVDQISLINWVRGQDNIGDEPSPGNGVTIRGTIHGDVLHSRPAIINYGGTYGVVAFYGANDGVFRAINANQPNNPTDVAKPKGTCTISTDCSIGGIAPGGELWGFIPTEFMTKLQRLYLNSPTVKLASTPTGIVPAPQPKDYFFDGNTTSFHDTVNNKWYVYLTARRGGRVIYAIDVTNPTDPVFMWKKTDTDIAELGQTWSQPKVALVHGHTNPVLVFGAGYDSNEDADPPLTDVMGRGIVIVDALNGNLVWQAKGPAGTAASVCKANPCLLTNMKYAISADIALVDTDFDGYVDRLYAADMGGNIWRVDLETTAGFAPATWQVTQLASLGGASGDATRRKFLFQPDVVVTKNYAAVLVGSGDREHPLQIQSGAYNTINRFYMIRDTKTGPDAQSTPAWSMVVDNSSSTTASAPTPSGVLFDSSTTAFDPTSSYKGFYLVLNQNAQSATSSSTLGEQVVNASTTIGGFTYFGTNQPKPADANSCSANLGNARGYKISFLTGSGGFTLFDGGGLPPSPVAGLVTVNVNGTDTVLPFLLGGGGGAVSGTVGGGTLQNCSGPDCKSSLGGQKPPIPIPVKKKRTYWYREMDR